MDFNDVIFAVSADCYSSVLFPEVSSEDRDKLRVVAREAVGVILNGARDYYMEADFSPEKLKKNKAFFWRKFAGEDFSGATVLRLHTFESLLDGHEEGLDSAVTLIGSVSARLRGLHTDGFSIEIGDALIDAISAVQGEEFYPNEVGQISWREINKIWDGASSEWDRYLVGVMCDVPDSICVTVNHLLNTGNSLDFLLRWRRGVSRKNFEVLLDAIEGEAMSELPTNKKVAKMVVEIIALLRN
ncbi:hypothetical protein [Burkholderia sp. Se-20378]|uniref:hypothetical protein n=1 Tax=Burkholderia sp. Se-20378 TaxID=2703899 RepID=UPI0019824C4F|nr:hypothetical protein [Burkholderia sp. Se-20378]MBN3768964.1 hypothetical protein [Burkholderia sp. Se-20378]